MTAPDNNFVTTGGPGVAMCKTGSSEENRVSKLSVILDYVRDRPTGAVFWPYFRDEEAEYTQQEILILYSYSSLSMEQCRNIDWCSRGGNPLISVFVENSAPVFCGSSGDRTGAMQV